MALVVEEFALVYFFKKGSINYFDFLHWKTLFILASLFLVNRV